MKTPKAKINKSIQRIWLRRILITLAIIILLPVGLFTIGWLNRDTVVDVLQEWYSENNTGTLTIGKVNASFLSEFPKVGFTLKDIEQTNTDTIADNYSKIQIDEVKLVLGAGNVLRGNIKFEKIYIKNAVISSEVRSDKSFAYHEQLKRTKQSRQRIGFRLPEWLDKNGVDFSLRNVKYITSDSILHKYFNLNIHSIKGNYRGENLNLNGDASLNITINDLGFNTKKGSYFNGARVTGSPKFKVDLANHTIEIPDFMFNIDEQYFQLNAKFDLTNANNYIFELQNPLTDFKAVKSLLPDSLAIKLKNYQILKPFQSKIRLEGKFAYGNNPDIEGDFSTDNNTIIVADQLHFRNATFSGTLTNDVYNTDSLKKAKKSPKDIKIVFNNLNANLEDIKVDISNGYFQSTPEALNFIEANIKLEGSNETLAMIIDTDNFDFIGGMFQLDAAISGDIPNPYQFLNKAIGNFSLKNTRVVLKKNGLQLPIQSIDLALKRENSILRQLIINLPNNDNLILKGELKSISGLLSKNPKTPTTSRILLDSKNLNINELITLSKRFIPKSDSKMDDRKTLHETLEAIYGQFHPRFEINLKALQYNDVIINNVSSNIELINSETILLRNFDFKYVDALTNLKGKVVVHGPESKLKDAIYINAEATSNGPINVFENLFNIQLFRIDSGDYKFYGTVKGNVKEFSELLNNARGDLNITNTKLHYAPAEMDIVIDSLALFVDKSDILLNKFKLKIDELHPITLNGNVKQFQNFLLDNAQGSGSVFLNIDAPYLDGDKLLAEVNSLKDEEKSGEPKIRKALHTIFKDISKFNPEIKLSIDSLKYKDLISEHIKALVYFENDSILKLNNLDLNYKQTTANIQGKVNSHTNQQTLINDNPFDFDFSIKVKGKAENLNDYLNTTNFVFKSGDFEFNGNYNGQSEDLDILSSNAFGDLKIGGTIVDYKAAGLQIPVDSLHIEIDDNLAKLKTLDIDLPGKSSIFFSGSIDNFSDFINSSKDSNLHSSDFSIYSPYLDTSDIKEFLVNTRSNKEKPEDKELNLQNFKDAMVKINSSFYPTIGIKLDTLRHKDFNLTDFGLKLLFDNQGIFKIEDTQLDFYGGSITMNVDVGLKNDSNMPVSIDMRATDINIHELVSRFDYFNNKDLRQTEKVEGNLNYNMKATGTLANDGKLNMDSLNGSLHIELDSLELFNYKPIMDNSILMKDERFKNLQFRPIVQTFEIINGELIIPRTEIQSSAIHLFVEGKMKFNEYIDVWLSLPWKNLQSRDGLLLPEKTNYEDAGSKFYVQLLRDKKTEKANKEKLKIKLRLSNRKLRKQKEN